MAIAIWSHAFLTIDFGLFRDETEFMVDSGPYPGVGDRQIIALPPECGSQLIRTPSDERAVKYPDCPACRVPLWLIRISRCKVTSKHLNACCELRALIELDFMAPDELLRRLLLIETQLSPVRLP